MGFSEQNALLTQSQREFLLGENETDQPAVYRNRIRTRIRRSLVDFCILFHHLDHEDWYRVLFEEDPNAPVRHLGGPSPDGDVLDEFLWDRIALAGAGTISTGGLRHVHSSLYYALLRSLQEELGIPLEDIVEQLVTEGIQDTYGKIGKVADVTVNIDVEFEDVDVVELQEKFVDGDLTDEELEWLVQCRYISPQELHEYLQDA